MAVDIDTRTIIRAAWTLHDRRSKWSTAEAIAEYLRAPLDDVERLLRELRRKRIFDARQRQGEKVWMPWGEAH
jgi:DNA-binding IscR family transcriptional regulator